LRAMGRADDDMHAEGRRGPRCPICKAPVDPAFKPFCSRRCADIDLSRWLRGAYAIPVANDDDDEDGDDGGPGPGHSAGQA
jgi:endogenous inhibitor of DNA gyrase (YacG/DUF329 family)